MIATTPTRRPGLTGSALALLGSLLATTAGATPGELVYEGTLHTADGPAADGLYSFRFRIFGTDDPADETPLWESRELPVDIDVEGRFLAVLEPFAEPDARLALTAAESWWLAVEIGGVALEGRQRLSAVPAAGGTQESTRAEDADTLQGMTPDELLGQIETGAPLTIDGEHRIGIRQCAAGSVLKYRNGAWTCATDDAGSEITAILTSDGLCCDGNSGAVELRINFAGSGAAPTAARSDHGHAELASREHVASEIASVAARLGDDDPESIPIRFSDLSPESLPAGLADGDDDSIYTDEMARDAVAWSSVAPTVNAADVWPGQMSLDRLAEPSGEQSCEGGAVIARRADEAGWECRALSGALPADCGPGQILEFRDDVWACADFAGNGQSSAVWSEIIDRPAGLDDGDDDTIYTDEMARDAVGWPGVSASVPAHAEWPGTLPWTRVTDAPDPVQTVGGVAPSDGEVALTAGDHIEITPNPQAGAVRIGVRTGPGSGLNADLLDGADAESLEESAEITAAVVAHATSDDHDGRYVTQAQVTEATEAAVAPVVERVEGLDSMAGRLAELEQMVADLQGRDVATLLRGETTFHIPADYPTLNDALTHLNEKIIPSGSRTTLLLAHGVYVFEQPLTVAHRDGARIRILGDVASPELVVLRFENVDGLVMSAGNQLGQIDGLKLMGAGGAAVGVRGTEGSRLLCGPTLIVEGFVAHGVVAEQGAFVQVDGIVVRDNAQGLLARLGGVISAAGTQAISNAGPGYLADEAGVIVAPGALAEGNTGWGFVAAHSGVAKVHDARAQSNGSGGAFGGFLAHRGGSIKAAGAAAVGNEGPGFLAQELGVIDADGASSVDNESSDFVPDCGALSPGGGLILCP